MATTKEGEPEEDRRERRLEEEREGGGEGGRGKKKKLPYMIRNIKKQGAMCMGDLYQYPLPSQPKLS